MSRYNDPRKQEVFDHPEGFIIEQEDQRVTVRALPSMTSGFVYFHVEASKDGRKYYQRFELSADDAAEYAQLIEKAAKAAKESDKPNDQPESAG